MTCWPDPEKPLYGDDVQDKTALVVIFVHFKASFNILWYFTAQKAPVHALVCLGGREFQCSRVSLSFWFARLSEFSNQRWRGWVRARKSNKLFNANNRDFFYIFRRLFHSTVVDHCNYVVPETEGITAFLQVRCYCMIKSCIREICLTNPGRSFLIFTIWVTSIQCLASSCLFLEIQLIIIIFCFVLFVLIFL